MTNNYDTIGVEIEIGTISRRRFDVLFSDPILASCISITNDASVESKVVDLSPITSVFDPEEVMENIPAQRNNIGNELVTCPLKFPDLEKVITKLSLGLERLGELPKSKRGSIHIHIGFNNDFINIRKALLFETKFESLLYRLGSMGYSFRGLANEAIYCRPFTTKYGPPVIRADGKRIVPVLVTEDLLNADSYEEFWRLYGIDYTNVNRYHPSRYFGFNLMSILLHHTLEFRFFNYTNNSNFILSAARLCQCIAELICIIPQKTLESLRESSVFVENDDLSLLEILFELIDQNNKEYKLTYDQKRVLQLMVRITLPVVLREGFVQSHLWSKFMLSEFYLDFGTRPKIDESSIRPSGFIDIHNFKPSQIDLIKLVNE